MNSEPTETKLPRMRRRVRRPTAGRQLEASVVTGRNLRIVDEAFADLEPTTLRRDEPVVQHVSNDFVPLHRGMVQELASQLRAWDAQRKRLAQLLQDLQAFPPAEIWRLSARVACDMLAHKGRVA